MSGSRNIFQKVGAAPDLSTKDPESESEHEEQDLENEDKSDGRVMNMKQEGFTFTHVLWLYSMCRVEKPKARRHETIVVNKQS